MINRKLPEIARKRLQARGDDPTPFGGTGRPKIVTKPTGEVYSTPPIPKSPQTPLGGTGRPKSHMETDTDGTRNRYTDPPIPKSNKAVAFLIESKRQRGAKLLEIDKQDRIAQNKSKGKTGMNSTQPRRTS